MNATMKSVGFNDPVHDHLTTLAAESGGNIAIRHWAESVLEGNAEAASDVVKSGTGRVNVVLSRDLARAKRWVRRESGLRETCGVIASPHAKRLAAEGLLVQYDTGASTWLNAPRADPESSSALERVQTSRNLTHAERDYCIVCWDGDLRRERAAWSSYKLSGGDWKKDKLLDVAKNDYRVILTCAQKGMVIFVPTGDTTGEDPTRDAAIYDSVVEFLLACGVRPLTLE